VKTFKAVCYFLNANAQDAAKAELDRAGFGVKVIAAENPEANSSGNGGGRMSVTKPVDEDERLGEPSDQVSAILEVGGYGGIEWWCIE
jgi:hypothetical protein